MKLHRYIDHDWQITPIDFQVKGQGHSDLNTLQLTAHFLNVLV